MKKLECLLISACAVLLCAACGQQRLDPDGSMHEVLFTIDGGATRATADGGESTVAEWCLYVVDARGSVVDAAVSTSSSVICKLSGGSYTAYAVVNCGAAPSTFSSLSQLQGKILSLDGESLSRLRMSGSKALSVPSDATCSIPVSRIVGKAGIEGIRTDFSAHPSLSGKPFTIDSIYLINVVAEAPLFGSAAQHSRWLNRRVAVSCSADDLLVDAVGHSGSSYDGNHCFFCYENNTATDSHGAAWSARRTRLVVACTLAGRRTYYPIDICDPATGRLLRNTYYKVANLVITDMGCDAPDDELPQTLPYTFDGEVLGWDDDINVNEQF